MLKSAIYVKVNETIIFLKGFGNEKPKTKRSVYLAVCADAIKCQRTG